MTGKSKNIRNILIVLVILGGAVGTFLYNRSATKAKEAEAAAFRETKITRGDVSISIRATGTVSPENRLEIKPPIAGRVETVLVKEGERVRRSQILAWMSSTERAAVLDAARAKGPEEVARWEELYRSTPVLSPINGTVILRSVEPGQTFASTDSILVLSDRLTVKAQVDETDLAQVKVGIKANVILDAYPGEAIPAKVSRIAFEAKTVNNVTMYEVYVSPETTPETMRSGMTATVRFDVASKENVIVVPNDAVKTEGNSTTVLVSNKGQRVKTKVELGLTDGKVSEVITGLSEGDSVVARVLGEASASEKASNPFMPTPPRAPGSGGKGRGSNR